MSYQLTIIIPVYNAEKHIEQCINSILIQSYNDYELILIDDGSTDDSSIICERFASKYANILYYRQENQGVSNARNSGLEKSSGVYVSFIDSDDFIKEDTYTSIFSSSTFKEFDLALFGYQFSYNGRLVPKSHSFGNALIHKNRVKKVLLILDMLDLFESVCNKIYRRDLINRLGLWFDQGTTYLEDLQFNCIYSQYVENLILRDDCHYTYRQDSTNSLSKRYVDDFLIIIEESIRLRQELFRQVSGIQKNRYNIFLDNKLLRARMNDLTMQYKNSAITRSERLLKWGAFLLDYKLPELNKESYDTFFTLAIMTKSPILIDILFSLYYRISLLKDK